MSLRAIGRRFTQMIAYFLVINEQQKVYCETHKTVKTRNIYEMLLYCEK